MTPEAPETLAVGVVLGGKYRILRPLGEGGMAVVFQAEHVKLGHHVAVKVLRPGLEHDASIAARFEREGRALSRLKSRHVVRVFDVDTTPSGAPILVMEYLEGRDLDAELRARGPLPIGEAVGIVLQACEAMQEAHDHGLVHRDLKPTNLFLAADGARSTVKVLDFGIAGEAPGAGDARLTQTEMVMGTPYYMAPEQFRSAKGVDARADVWALGATLYELLTGEPPFTGTATTIGVAVVTEEARPIEALRPEVPKELCDIVRHTLEKDRDKRVQTMAALAEALSPFGSGVVIAPRSSRHSFPEIDVLEAAETKLVLTPVGPSTEAAVTRESREPPPGRARARGWAALALAPLAAVALWTTSRTTTHANAGAGASTGGTGSASAYSAAASPAPAVAVDAATHVPVTPSPPVAPSVTASARADAPRPALRKPPLPAKPTPDPPTHPLFYPP